MSNSTVLLLAMLAGLIVGAWRMVQAHLRWFDDVVRDQQQAQREYFGQSVVRHHVRHGGHKFNEYGEVITPSSEEL